MVGTMHGTHENVEVTARMRNKRVSMIPYEDVRSIEVLDSECLRHFSPIIKKIRFVLSSTVVELECSSPVSDGVYHILVGNVFNKLEDRQRKSIFDELIKSIHRGN